MTSFIGILAILVFLLVVIINNHMQTITNFYLVNLAIADTVFLASTGVTTYLRHIGVDACTAAFADGYYASFQKCLAKTVITHITYFASIGFITLVAYERFMAVCFPLQAHMIRSKKRTALLLFAVWSLSVICAVVCTAIIGGALHTCIDWPGRIAYSTAPEQLYACFTSNPIKRMVFAILQAIPFTIALAFNVTFHINIFLRLQRRIATHQDQEEQNSRTNRQITQMLAINSFAFFICLAPNQIAILSYNVGKYALNEYWNLIFRCLELVNSAVNPFIYGIINSNYRKALCETFRIKKCHQNRHEDPGTQLNHLNIPQNYATNYSSQIRQ